MALLYQTPNHFKDKYLGGASYGSKVDALSFNSMPFKLLALRGTFNSDSQSFPTGTTPPSSVYWYLTAPTSPVAGNFIPIEALVSHINTSNFGIFSQ